MKCLIFCYTLVIILVLVKSSTKYCVFEGSNANQAHCGIHDTNSIFYSIPEILRNITYIDLWGQPLKQLPNNAFKILPNHPKITSVVLQSCQIAQINVDAFINLENLELVDLSFNNINQINVGTFQKVPTIQYIFLEHNHISVLPKGLLQNLTSLKRIHLNYNRIAHIEEDAFKNTPQLRSIDLSNNKLQTLDMSFKDYLGNKMYLYLHDNPWTCNDGLIGIYEYFLENIKKYDIKYVPKCEDPFEMRGRKWNDTLPDEFRHNIAAQELNDNRDEQPKTSLISLSVGEISGISFIALIVIFIGMLAYMYSVRQIIYDKVSR